MRYHLFDRSKLKVKPLSDRMHGMNISAIRKLNYSNKCSLDDRFIPIARRMIEAKKNGVAIILMMGAHVIRSGVKHYLINLMERGYLTCISMNGAGVIHDYEFALIGATTESVAEYIKSGEFGLWRETSWINDIINDGYQKGFGLGEAVGKAILEGNFPHSGISLLAAGYRLKIPVTVHVGIGYDIIHEHPNCNGAAMGETSYRDFLYFVNEVQRLENGIIMNFGSAVMAPEVFLKALSMARNVAKQESKVINNFLTLVCDIKDLPNDFKEEPSKNNPLYYFRPLKTMLIRTVQDGGESFYIRGKHEETIPSLWAAINEEIMNPFENP